MHQICLLSEWRMLIKEGNEIQANSILHQLLGCINAIAGAIGFTG
jgi:hypothetical protein